MKEFADDSFKFDKNARKLSKPGANTLGKREIARYEQFLLFQQCFQKTCTEGLTCHLLSNWTNLEFCHSAKS